MFKINMYRYIDTTSGLGFVIYARTLETAEKIKEAINNAYGYKLRKRRLFFIKHMLTDAPPYEVEMAQFDGIDEAIEYRTQ